MVETLRSAPSANQPARRISKIARMRGVKVAAIAAAVLIGATAAGAATNRLPGPAQRAISEAASHLGLSLPKPSARHGGPGRAGKPVGPDAAAHAKYGLCSAYAGGAVDHQSAQPQRQLCRVRQSQRAADAAGMSIADYCKNAAPPNGKSGRAPETDTTLPHGAHPTAPPVSTPHRTGPPVSTPHSTGPPVSTPHSTGPPVSTPHSTGPPVSTPHSTGPPVSTPGDAHRP